MFEQDYILRMIAQLGVMLRAMREALREHRPDDVLKTADEAVGVVLGMDARLADAIAPDGLVALLGGAGRLDTARALSLAEVFTLRAQAAGELGNLMVADVARSKAISLAYAIIDHEPESEAAQRAEELLGVLGAVE